ncbi:unnamed protein product [Closterium sp. Naga37s-1]|nr:unnamed protein product [Closterium sp. Naga37s-1]
MVDPQRSDSDGAAELREHDDGQSLLGRADSDAATCGCIPVMRAVAGARDVARHSGADSGPSDGGARDGESSHARTPDLEPAVSSDCEMPRDAAAAGADRASDSPRARPQRLDDPLRNAAEIDGCSVGVTLEPPSHDDSVAAEPKPPVAKLPRMSIGELSVTTYSYISHRAFVRELLCSCCSRHATTCAARTGRHCNGCDCSSGSSTRHGGSSSSRLAGWAEVALDRVSIVAHLTTFSFLGVAVQHGMDLLFGPEVAVQHGMDLLFGPEVAHVTSNQQAIFIDLPANMLGCFLLGMLGVVFLPALLTHSRHLAIGLVVGLCGSISTCATWNQRMLAIATAGLWVRALFGYYAGSVLPIISVVAGADTAHNLCSLHSYLSPRSPSPHSSPSPSLLPTANPTPPYTSSPSRRPSPSQPTSPPFSPSSLPARRHLIPMLLCALSLWGAAITGAVLAAAHSASLQAFCLACALAPLGTCLRWSLLPLNGAGLGTWFPRAIGRWKGVSGAVGRKGAGKPEGGTEAVAWMPWGTLTANVGAAALEAAISVAYLAVHTVFDLCLRLSFAHSFVAHMQVKTHASQVIVGGVQLGFLTGLSTVSMFSLEILYFHYTLGTPWRSYVYILTLATLVAALAVLAPASATTYRSTFSDGINSGGGACYYEGNFRDSEYFYKGLTAYLPQNKYDGGKGCGTCYEIECKNHKSCRSGSVIVRATGRHGDDQFLLASTAWDKIVRGRDAGNVEIKFRSVDCPKNGDIGVKIMPGTNQYWFAVQILGAAKAGGVEGVELSKDGKKWSKMKRLAESATWALDPAKEIVDAGKKVSVRVTAVGGARVELKDVIPEKWTVGNTYKSSTNF